MDESRGDRELERVLRSADAGNSAGRPHQPTAADSLIEFLGVGHTYRSIVGRTVRAVEDFSLTIREGEVLGLAGPNGAGKSTLISLLLGYLEPTKGEIRIAGMRPRAFVERHGIGYLSELMAMPPRWTAMNALRRYAILAGVRRHESTSRIARVVEMLGLEDQLDKRVKQLSKGNLQRLGLAQSLLREERVIILDEPTHGLDPVWTQRFRDVVDMLRHPGRAIFIASHNLDELQRLADRVAIIDQGRLQRVVEPRAQTTSIAPYLIDVLGDHSVVTAVFPGALERAAGQFELPAVDVGALNAGVSTLIQRGVMVTSLRPAHSVLEQHFREAVDD